MSNLSTALATTSTARDAFGHVSNPLEYVTLGTTLLVLLLGGYVGYQAYRGYRRNDNRPVLFLGVGIFLVTTVRQLAAVSLSFVLPGFQLLHLTVFFLITIVGLIAILYAFIWA